VARLDRPAVETGTEYSHGYPLLKPSAYNNIGQKYQGPVLLVTDAMCYSTTDIFAAGFQDHRIGTVLGVDDNTGAGGANVWEYRFIADLFGNGKQFPASLPGDASFRFAVRRVTRIGPNTGVLLEDLGVRPDKRHYLTRRDVLERNVDLIEKAAALLSRKPTQLLSAARSGRQVRVRCDNVDRIDAYLDDRPLTSKAVRRNSLVFSLGTDRPKARQMRLEGFRGGQLVAATRVALG
jgi:C-terminal processing protease CtpA/Prc